MEPFIGDKSKSAACVKDMGGALSEMIWYSVYAKSRKMYRYLLYVHIQFPGQIFVIIGGKKPTDHPIHYRYKDTAQDIFITVILPVAAHCHKVYHNSGRVPAFPTRSFYFTCLRFLGSVGKMRTTSPTEHPSARNSILRLKKREKKQKDSSGSRASR